MAREVTCISCGRIEYRDTNRGQALFCCDCWLVHNTEALRAISKVSDAVQRGQIQKATAFACVDCGAPAKHYDHRDYTEPLVVEPVCVPCNIKRGPARDSQMRAVLPVSFKQAA